MFSVILYMLRQTSPSCFHLVLSIFFPSYCDVSEARRYFASTIQVARSRVSSGSIVSDYGLDDRAIGVRSPVGAKIFPLVSASRPALGPTQPPVKWVQGVLSPGVKARPGLDADHSHPSSAEVKNE
jgi:hypothetical protein